MSDSDFCVVDQDCAQCHASGVELYRITAKPLDGGEWPTLFVLCDGCLRGLHSAISDHIRLVGFRSGTGE